MRAAGTFLTIALMATLGSAHPLTVVNNGGEETMAAALEEPAIVARQASTEVGQQPAIRPVPAPAAALAPVSKPASELAPASLQPASTPEAPLNNNTTPSTIHAQQNQQQPTTSTRRSTSTDTNTNIDINTLLSLALSLFPLNIALSEGELQLAAANQALALALGIDATQNANGQCADMTIVFARGTTEAGNVGTIAGPPMFEAVKAMAKGMSVAVQGVDYAANVQGFLVGGDPKGSKEMADQVTKFMTACPNTKLVMSGYSQGGQLVHNAAAMLPAAVTARVSSAVIFGDPDNGQPVAGVGADKTLVICHNGDNICAGGSLVLAPHLTYGRDADTAAKFIVGNAVKDGAGAGAAAGAA